MISNAQPEALTRRIGQLLSPILLAFPILLLGCEQIFTPEFLVTHMDANEIKKAKDADLCLGYAQTVVGNPGWRNLPIMAQEIQSRHLNCNNQFAQVNAQVALNAAGGAVINNNASPQCAGVTVVNASVGSSYGGLVRSLYITIANSSRQRRSVMADIKIYREGPQSPFFNEAGEKWQQGGPFILRSDDATLDFPVMANPGPNDRITAVNVLGCGG